MKSPRRHIFLVGFSGCGKSTVGPLLARKLGYRFVDTDTEIEKTARTSIAAIFSRQGEPAFRKMEMNTIAKAAEEAKPSVIALGGGAVLKAPNRITMKKTGTTIYLRCALRELHRRLSRHTDRPLLEPTGETRLQRMTRLLRSRRPLYEATADIIVSTTNKRPNEVVREITRRLGR